MYYNCQFCGTPTESEQNSDLEARTCKACSRYLSLANLSPERRSPYVKVVEKTWGQERWIANSPMYCSKFLDVKYGHGTSIHHHEKKFETMVVISGGFRIMIENDFVFMYEGDILNISPYQIHKIDALTPELSSFSDYAVMLEISTQHFDDDSIRHGTDLKKYLEELEKEARGPEN